jgi:hypothetical protein
VRLTSIGQLSGEVTRGLDTMRNGVLSKVAEAEAVLAAAASRTADPVRS